MIAIIITAAFTLLAFYTLFPEWFKRRQPRDLSYSMLSSPKIEPPPVVSRRDSQPVKGERIKMSMNSKTRVGYRRRKSKGIGFEYFDEFGRRIDDSMFDIYVMELLSEEFFYPSNDDFNLNDTTEASGFLKHGDLPSVDVSIEKDSSSFADNDFDDD